MADDRPFTPNWCIHPGVPLAEWLDHEKCPPNIFAKCAGIDRSTLDDLLACKPSARITEDLAERIHHACCVLAIGPSAQFWLNYDMYYHEGLERGARDCSADYIGEKNDCS